MVISIHYVIPTDLDLYNTDSFSDNALFFHEYKKAYEKLLLSLVWTDARLNTVPVSFYDESEIIIESKQPTFKASQ